jgi:hypothetical protein
MTPTATWLSGFTAPGFKGPRKSTPLPPPPPLTYYQKPKRLHDTAEVFIKGPGPRRGFRCFAPSGLKIIKLPTSPDGPQRVSSQEKHG